MLRDRDPRVLLAAADVLVLTSAWESLPFCVLEAMQAALPVVAYDVGDLSSQVADSGSGFLVRPFDLDEMARRVGLLVEHPALRVALGEAGNRRLAERFSYAAMVAAVDGVYREALALGAASSAPVTPPAPVPTGRLVEVTP